MSETRKKADWPIVTALAALALLIVTAGLYVVGYFTLGTVGRGDMYPDEGPTTIRYFDAHWQAAIYRPLGMVEGTFVGKHVVIAGPQGTGS